MSAHPIQFICLVFAGLMNRRQRQVIDYLQGENRILRAKLGPKRLRFNEAERKKLARLGKRIGRKMLGRHGNLAHPDTILRWYRELIARKYDGSEKRGPGRPRVMATIRKLVIQFALENRTWGYTRICGALDNVGHKVGRSTIKRILCAEGIDPAPERGKHMPWSTFLKAHWGAVAGMDFFTVEVLTWFGLIRYHVLFVIDLKTRSVQICGIHVNPAGEWMKQMARNLTDAFDGFLCDTSYLILDRDPLYTKDFRRMLRDAGTKPLRLPAKSPNLNAHAERFVRSIKEECLSRVVILGEGHLRILVSNFVSHYHGERNHQGLDNKLIKPDSLHAQGSIQCRERLGGLLRYYHRKAA